MTRLASILLVATVFSPAAWAGALGSRDHSQVVARGDQSTITDPNFRCPEAIGKDMMKCSDDLCGGENPKKKGYCRRGVLIQRPEQKPLQPHYCHCDPKEGLVHFLLSFLPSLSGLYQSNANSNSSAAMVTVVVSLSSLSLRHPLGSRRRLRECRIPRKRTPAPRTTQTRNATTARQSLAGVPRATMPGVLAARSVPQMMTRMRRSVRKKTARARMASARS